MQEEGQQRSALTADEFFALVDEYLTPAMAALGYHRIDGYVNDQPGSRSIDTNTGGNGPSQPFVRFDFGYEAGSEEVKRLLGPDDPETEDEWWLHYEPATGRLDLHAWQPVASVPVDWDIWTDHGPCTVAEVRHRLSAVGRAALAYAREHRGDTGTH